jgi:hypothetical protein
MTNRTHAPSGNCHDHPLKGEAMKEATKKFWRPGESVALLVVGDVEHDGGLYVLAADAFVRWAQKVAARDTAPTNCYDQVCHRTVLVRWSTYLDYACPMPKGHEFDCRTWMLMVDGVQEWAQKVAAIEVPCVSFCGLTEGHAGDCVEVDPVEEGPVLDQECPRCLGYAVTDDGLKCEYCDFGLVAHEGDCVEIDPPNQPPGPTLDGRKFDSDKPRYDLFPVEAMAKIVDVLSYGARKYSPGNWRKVPDARARYYAAALRHLTAWWGGEELDGESGLEHLAHAACCVVFLLALPKETK